MDDKFKKQTNCEYCQKEMEAAYRNKRFCSDKCRVYSSRENKKEIIVKVNNLNVPTDVIKPEEKPKSNYSINTIPAPDPSNKGEYLKWLKNNK